MTLIGAALEGRPAPKLLDIGCSTENLLGQLAVAFPHVNLIGGDMSDSALAEAHRFFPSLSFRRLNMLELPYEGEFDIIVANAVTYPR